MTCIPQLCDLLTHSQFRHPIAPDRQSENTLPVKNAAGRLLSQLNTDHDRTHDIINLEVSLRTVGMGIMAADTGLSDGQVGIHRFIITSVAYLRDPGEGMVGLSHNSTQRNTLERSCRDISLVDRP